MTLLELDGVSKSYNRGARERVALRDVSLKLDPGELVAVWGLRRSGRSTLLRIAAGVEAPDTGVVRLHGHDLAGRDAALDAEVGYCRTTFHPADGHTMLDQVMAVLLARGVSMAMAQSCARVALQRAGVERYAGLGPNNLNGAETVRVAVARALAVQPRLLMIDEPTKGVDLLDRDDIPRLLRSLAEEGIAVLACTGDTACLCGADRALSIGHGELRGSLAPELATVSDLAQQRELRASAC
jgi:putative ABC transport system ATP-binding protein